MIGEVRIPDLADVHHRLHRGLDIGMDAETDRGVDGGAKPGRIVGLSALHRQTEDVGGQLRGGGTP
jgi:hypothetical protein